MSLLLPDEQAHLPLRTRHTLLGLFAVAVVLWVAYQNRDRSEEIAAVSFNSCMLEQAQKAGTTGVLEWQAKALCWKQAEDALTEGEDDAEVARD